MTDTGPSWSADDVVAVAEFTEYVCFEPGCAVVVLRLPYLHFLPPGVVEHLLVAGTRHSHGTVGYERHDDR